MSRSSDDLPCCDYCVYIERAPVLNNWHGYCKAPNCGIGFVDNTGECYCGLFKPKTSYIIRQSCKNIK